jgi:chlorobactene glucosyltransferase
MNLLLDNVVTLLLLVAFACAVCFAANGLFNHNALSRLTPGSARQQPLVSILIPCRNEQEHIAACLDSILQQKYSHLQILVLDDHSEDESANILSRYTKENDNVTIIQGSSLPEGWTGKNWACHQLYAASRGDVLLYCDADTQIGQDLIRDAVAELESRALGFVSIFPERKSRNVLDRWIWSFTSWVIASWIPLWLAYQTRLGVLAVGFGQFLMLRRNVYEAIGGYEALRGNSLDDFSIARRIQAAGIDWRVYSSGGRLTTESYRSTKDAIEGYGKSILPALGGNGLTLLLVWVLLANVTWTPVILLILDSLKWITITTDQLQLASFCVMAILISWAAAAVKLRISALTTLLYPIAITSVLYTAVTSYLGIRRGTMTWKDRIIVEADEVMIQDTQVTNQPLDSASDTSASNSES